MKIHWHKRAATLLPTPNALSINECCSGGNSGSIYRKNTGEADKLALNS